VRTAYVGKIGTGIVQLVLTFTLIGLIIVIPWVLIDEFLIPGMVRESNARLRNYWSTFCRQNS
jgi:hypothetical protein